MTISKRSLEFCTNIIGIVCLCFCLYHLIQLVDVIVNVAIPFDTDESDHANAALELYYALKSGSPSFIIDAINRQSFYPPLHSFLVVPFLLVAGESLAISRVPSFVLLISSILIFLYTLVRTVKISKQILFFCIVTTCCFFIESPIISENSALCMLEMLGVFIVVLLLLAGCHEQKNDFSLLGLCFALTLTKYSFAAMVVPAVFTWLFFESLQKSSVTSSLVRICKLSLIFFALIAAWLCFAKFDSVIKFFTSHPSYTPLLGWENISFDFSGWIYHFHNHWIVGVFSLCLILISFLNLRSTPVIRLCKLIVLNSLFVLLCSSTNEVRHFIVAFPPLIYLTLYPLIASTSTTPLHSFLKISLICVMTLGTYLNLNLYRVKIINGLEGRPEYQELQLTLMKIINPKAPTLVIGTIDQLGIESIRWHAAVSAQIPYSSVEFSSFPYREDKNLTQKIRSRNIDIWFLEPTFPLQFHEIVKREHFKQIVIIRKVGGTDPLISEILKSYPTAPFKRKIFGDRELIVIDRAALGTQAG
jgi:hypothetical protein